MQEAPGSVYVVDARAKITQCWRRLAEAELMVGIFYVNNMSYPAAEKRLKELLETYPEYVDRERAYYYLGEAMRRKGLDREVIEAYHKDFLAKHQLDGTKKFTSSCDIAKQVLASSSVSYDSVNGSGPAKIAIGDTVIDGYSAVGLSADDAKKKDGEFKMPSSKKDKDKDKDTGLN